LALANANGKLILVVDDEPAVVRAVTVFLASAGYVAIVAENGASGLELFQASADQIDLVLADIVMPVLDGVSMANAIRKIRPNVPVLLMTGDSESVITTISKESFPFIKKPFLAAELIRAIEVNLASSDSGSTLA